MCLCVCLFCFVFVYFCGFFVCLGYFFVTILFPQSVSELCYILKSIIL